MGKLQKKPLSLFVDIGEGFTEEVPSEMIINMISVLLIKKFTGLIYYPRCGLLWRMFPVHM